MAEFVLHDDQVQIFLDYLKLSSYLRNVDFGVSKGMPEFTTFADEFRRFLPGTKEATFSATSNGDFANDSLDEILDARMSTSDNILALTSGGGVVGSPAYFYKAALHRYAPFESGQMSEPSQFGIEATMSTAPLVRGMVLEDSRTLRGDDFTGTVVDFGTPPAGKSLYGVICVIQSGAPATIDVIVQSDDNVGMATPATAITFTTASGLTAQMLSSSSNLQRYYRISCNHSVASNWRMFVAVGYAL